MILTPEQKDAVRCEENLSLSACPGSGKTRVIISKLIRAINEVRDTSRSVACITYTNTAVHEIESRLRQHIQPGDDIYYDICTIHSFCLNHIFRPFCHLIKGYEKGFKVLTPENTEFVVQVKATYAAFNRFDLKLSDYEEFTQLRVSLDGKPVGDAIDHGSLTPEIAIAYWERIRGLGYIDFANIIYYSLVLLLKHSEILSYVSSKFAWILVDEFQDTTDLQVEILSYIAKAGKTRFLIVGDKFQSIFSFAGARPDLANEFAKRINARTDFELSGNFRSSPPIIAQAELLFPRTPPMTSLGPAKIFTEVPYWQHGRSTFGVITDYFLPTLDSLDIPIGEAAILAPSWYSLFPLGKRLRDYGISIVGPGARPYRRNRQFAPLAEQICGYLIEPNPDTIVGIERTLFNTLLDTTGRTYFDIFSYKGRVIVFCLLKEAQKLQDTYMGAVPWLENAADVFSQILFNEGYLSNDERNLFAMSVEEMKMDMRNNKVDLANLSIDDLGIYASPDKALKLSTIHNAKGREYQAVAMIDLHEGRIPYYNIRTTAGIEEAKRLFYVGLTRAKRVILYITDDYGWKYGPSRFICMKTGIGVCKVL